MTLPHTTPLQVSEIPSPNCAQRVLQYLVRRLITRIPTRATITSAWSFDLVYRSLTPPTSPKEHEGNYIYQLLLEELPENAMLTNYFLQEEVSFSENNITSVWHFSIAVNDDCKVTPLEWHEQVNYASHANKSTGTQTPKAKLKTKATQTSVQRKTAPEITDCIRQTTQENMNRDTQICIGNNTENKADNARNRKLNNRINRAILNTVSKVYTKMANPDKITADNWRLYSRLRVDTTFTPELTRSWYYQRRQHLANKTRATNQHLQPERNRLMAELQAIDSEYRAGINMHNSWSMTEGSKRYRVVKNQHQKLTQQILDLNEKMSKLKLV